MQSLQFCMHALLLEQFIMTPASIILWPWLWPSSLNSHSGLCHSLGHQFFHKKIFISDFCVMNGKTYTQGQQWYDSCDRICVCEDGKSGFYRCRDRWVVKVRTLITHLMTRKSHLKSYMSNRYTQIFCICRYRSLLYSQLVSSILIGC